MFVSLRSPGCYALLQLSSARSDTRNARMALRRFGLWLNGAVSAACQ